MKLVIDIDGVICSNTWGEYEDADPYYDKIEYVNKLYDAGHDIVFFTARGTDTGIDWRELTEKQFHDWKVQYSELLFGKPSADYYIDDKAMKENELEWLSLPK
jgi:hypothetical protein